jgi:hypothetical protein
MLTGCSVAFPGHPLDCGWTATAAKASNLAVLEVF